MNPEFLQRQFLDNTVENYLWFTGILLAGLIFKKILSGLLSRILYFIFRKHGRSIGWDRFIKLTNRPFQLLLMLVLVYISFLHLQFPAKWNLADENHLGVKMVLQRTFYSLLVFASFWVFIRMVDFIFLVSIERARQTENKFDDQLLPFVKEGVKVIIAAIGFLSILSVAFNLDVVGLVTGLGIGGLAFALAAKETLENLLGSFTIFFDKPFSIGQVVKVGNVEGTVESIGFRSTKIRPADNTLITMPNKKMVDAELINETEREKRKSVFTFAVSVETKEEQLKNLISKIRSLLHQHEMISDISAFVSLRNITPTGIEIFCSFYIMSPEMADFLNVQEQVNFQILAILKEEKISFPVQDEKHKDYFTINPGKSIAQL